MCLCSCLLTWILFADRDSNSFLNVSSPYDQLASRPGKGSINIPVFHATVSTKREVTQVLTWLHEASDWRDLTVCFRVEGLNYLPTCFLLPLKLPSPLVSKRWVIQFGDIYHFYKTAVNLPRFSGMTTPYKLLSHIDKQWLIRLEQSPPLQDFRFSENVSSVAVVRSTWFLDWPLLTRYFKLKMNFVFCLCFVGPLLSPQESVALLTQAGLFDNAFTVASHFNLPKETIFEGLASR